MSRHTVTALSVVDGKDRYSDYLEAGTYLINVHPAYRPRIWKFNGEGFEGHGSKLKSAEMARGVGRLISKAELLEGIDDGSR